MTINALDSLNKSAEQMGNLLKTATKASMGLNDKLLKINVAEKVSSTGNNIDISA